MNNKAIKKPLLALCVALSCAWAGQASAMTKEEYKSAHDRIGVDFKAQKQRCDAMKANAKDVCVSEAKGAEKVAKAELEAQYKPNDKAQSKLMEARADATYDTAKEKCDDLNGNQKDVCVKDAKAAHVAALGQAKVQKTSAAGGSTNKVSEARKDAAEDRKDANYSAAKERCDAMSGANKDRCIADAKAKFGV